SKEKVVFSNITCFDDRVKNISGLVRTVARLREHRTDFELRLIGTGPDKPAIEKLVADLGLTSQIYFTGLLFDDQLVDEIILSDFTVLFSHYETMAVVIAESLACGRPVVATRAGGIPELIGSANGLLVEPGNEEDLLQQLLRMMDLYKNYNPIELRSRAYNMFSTQSVSEAFEKLYSFSNRK
ncbi:MAG: glycosyltransferase, partial [Bacteroidales bacterium]